MGVETVRTPQERNLAEIRRRVDFVFQDPDEQLFMPTVREDVAFGPATAGLRGTELEARVLRALKHPPRCHPQRGRHRRRRPYAGLLCDEKLMRSHRLELPFGFDPRSVSVPSALRQRSVGVNRL